MPFSISGVRAASAILLFCALILSLWTFWPAQTRQPPTIQQKWRCKPSASSQHKRVAIIGAGSAGSSAAYYLHEFGGDCHDIEIDVFERNSYVGGRSTTVNAYGDPILPVELGASIFVEVNQNLVSAAERFGLVKQTAFVDVRRGSSPKLGVWDGLNFVYTQDDDEQWWKTVAKLLWKYGLAPIRTQHLMKATVGKFLKMYDEPIFPFRSLSQAAYDVGLTAVTSSSGWDFLKANGVAPPFSTDLIQASTRVNYAQNLAQLHGLETMVCMATDGAMAIQGGNWQIFAEMLQYSEATVHINTTADGLTYHENEESGLPGGYAVRYTNPGGSLMKYGYDDVIIAAPLQFADLDLPAETVHMPDKIDYVSLHVTLFTTPLQLHWRAFTNPDRPEMFEIPSTILTTLPKQRSKEDDSIAGSARNHANTTTAGDCCHEPPTHPHFFFSISTLREVVNPATGMPEYLYKIFSPAPLTDWQFIHLFLGESFDPPPPDYDRPVPAYEDVQVSWRHDKAWNSYPYLPPRVTFEQIQLADTNGRGLWYTAGIESFISTMETSSLMGMNVARLMVEGWEEQDGQEQVEEVDGRDALEPPSAEAGGTAPAPGWNMHPTASLDAEL